VKLTNERRQKGFTLVEIMVGIALGTIVLGAIIAASVSLNRTFAAVDNFFSTHLQQVRIIDYLNRDVKRSNIAEISANAQTVYCWVPKYVIESGDTDATADNINTRRTPMITKTGYGYQVNYYPGTAQNGPGGTSTNSSAVVYSINGQSILRTEDGAVTTIASSTDQLVDQITDVNLASSGYLSTVVSFLPIFTSNGAAMERAGTTVYSTAYLRNLRRGN
jgi:prepilin-type N-terminal cleavage/methylation domain-containing protein